MHPGERQRIKELAEQRAQQTCKADDSACMQSQRLYWTDMLQRAAEGRTDDDKAAANEQLYGQIIGATEIANSGGQRGGSVAFFEDLRTAQLMLNGDVGRPILDSRGNPVLGTDGLPQTYFGATDAQRANPCGNTLLCDRSGTDIVANRAQRDEQQIENLRAVNGSAQPVYPVEEVVLGGAVGNRVVRTLGRAVGEEVVTAEQAAANRLTDKVTEETFALERVGQNNRTAGARIDNSVLNRSGQQLTNELAATAKVRPDTSQDAFYATNTDRTVLANNNFDMAHVLSGEINAGGKATGYHAEFAANGQARVTPGATVTQNANGTYDAPVQIWNDTTRQWVDKTRPSTFFPPSWSEARVTYEVTEAFKNGVPGTSFQSTTPSGIQIQFYWDAKNQRVTFFPIK